MISESSSGQIETVDVRFKILFDGDSSDFDASRHRRAKFLRGEPPEEIHGGAVRRQTRPISEQPRPFTLSQFSTFATMNWLLSIALFLGAIAVASAVRGRISDYAALCLCDCLWEKRCR